MSEQIGRTLLPGAAYAWVPFPKLPRYLLSLTHPVGKGKAKFFRDVGFGESTVQELEHGLLAIARSELVTEAVASPHGTKYVVDGILDSPSGARVRVRTVWIVEHGKAHPRFVTAYPLPNVSEEP